MPGAPFTWTKAGLELEIGLGDSRLVDANDRRSGPYDGKVGRVGAPPGCAPSSPQTGTDGSHPLPPRTKGKPRQPRPCPLPDTLFSIVFLCQRDYSNQFCLNQFKNIISS